MSLRRIQTQIGGHINEIRKYLASANDIPGYEDPSLIDTQRWQRVSSADIKFALKESWRMYWEGWAALRKTAAPESEGKETDSATRTAAAGDTLPSSESGSAAADWIIRGAAHMSGHMSDPAAREKLMHTAQQYATHFKEALDQFVAGYTDGKTKQLEKLQRHQAESAVSAPSADTTKQQDDSVHPLT